MQYMRQPQDADVALILASTGNTIRGCGGVDCRFVTITLAASGCGPPDWSSTLNVVKANHGEGRAIRA